MATGNEKDEKNSNKQSASNHPSRDLSARSTGFGIAAGYERPYRRARSRAGKQGPGAPKAESDSGRDLQEVYGPMPPAGYYGTGTAARPFERGQAGFADELPWYKLQYGEKTSAQSKTTKTTKSTK